MFASDMATSIKLPQIKLLHGTDIGRAVNKAEGVGQSSQDRLMCRAHTRGLCV